MNKESNAKVKTLKCYCNDDYTCPKVPANSNNKQSNDILNSNNNNNNNQNIVFSINNNNNESKIENYDEIDVDTNKERYCVTNTVCLTKRLKRSNGTTWLKYFCDQSSSNSIRGKVIEYRDCKINSTNKIDQKHVIESSAEYCCDTNDFCNRDLNPINSVIDIEDFSNTNQIYGIKLPNSNNNNNHLLTDDKILFDGNNKEETNTGGMANYGPSLFTSLNIVLLTCLFFVLILTFIIMLLYVIKRRSTKLRKLKLDNHSSLSTTSSNSTSSSTAATSLNSKENSYNNSYYPHLHHHHQHQHHQHMNHLHHNNNQVHLNRNVNVNQSPVMNCLIQNQNNYLNGPNVNVNSNNPIENNTNKSSNTNSCDSSNDHLIDTTTTTKASNYYGDALIKSIDLLEPLISVDLKQQQQQQQPQINSQQQYLLNNKFDLNSNSINYLSNANANSNKKNGLIINENEIQKQSSSIHQNAQNGFVLSSINNNYINSRSGNKLFDEEVKEPLISSISSSSSSYNNNINNNSYFTKPNTLNHLINTNNNSNIIGNNINNNNFNSNNSQFMPILSNSNNITNINNNNLMNMNGFSDVADNNNNLKQPIQNSQTITISNNNNNIFNSLFNNNNNNINSNNLMMNSNSMSSSSSSSTNSSNGSGSGNSSGSSSSCGNGIASSPTTTTASMTASPITNFVLNSSSNNINSSSTNNSNGYEWSGSGSGAGVPQLLQRTIARQIKLIYPCIGKGRFGEVYKGMWRDEYVAVKTFNSADEKSWENECKIYNTSGFRHENILGFIAADNIDRGTYTELWIITEFHENGSLFDYLNVNALKPLQALKMALSIVNGLDHLHTPIESCTGKPALAHCDLKSKNILVKQDLTCCIGDLGLALSGDKMGNVIQQGYIRTGTKRYMAPEILCKTIDTRCLYEFQKAEMYSLALVFWELLRRCIFELETPTSTATTNTTNITSSQTELATSSSSSSSSPDLVENIKTVYVYEYKLPYYEYVSMDPEEAQMKQIVCDLKMRPEINSLWRQVPILNELTQLTEELWVENADGRLNALRLKKSLNLVKRKYT